MSEEERLLREAVVRAVNLNGHYLGLCRFHEASEWKWVADSMARVLNLLEAQKKGGSPEAPKE